jgi:hypothetical protein
MKFNPDGSVAQITPIDPALRGKALELAIGWYGETEVNADDVVDAAQTFLDFLTGKEKPGE